MKWKELKKLIKTAIYQDFTTITYKQFCNTTLGIWNLLKTILNNTPSPSTQTAKTAENQTENTPSVTKSAPPENGVTIQEQESKETPPRLPLGVKRFLYLFLLAISDKSDHSQRHTDHDGNKLRRLDHGFRDTVIQEGVFEQAAICQKLK